MANIISFDDDACFRCGRVGYLHNHHIYRVSNNEKATVRVCPECHHWIHMNPGKAREEGLYLKMDGVIRKKKTNKNKWKIRKQYSK